MQPAVWGVRMLPGPRPCDDVDFGRAERLASMASGMGEIPLLSMSAGTSRQAKILEQNGYRYPSLVGTKTQNVGNWPRDEIRERENRTYTKKVRFEIVINLG